MLNENNIQSKKEAILLGFEDAAYMCLWDNLKQVDGNQDDETTKEEAEQLITDKHLTKQEIIDRFIKGLNEYFNNE
jgi:hypothetical protein